MAYRTALRRGAAEPVGTSSEEGGEVAASRVEQAGEQPVRPPVLTLAGEPDLDVPELVEHGSAME